MFMILTSTPIMVNQLMNENMTTMSDEYDKYANKLTINHKYIISVHFPREH